MSAVTQADWRIITYQPRGAARALFSSHDSEVMVSGPAGTGKTRAWLELVHLRAAKYAGSRHLLVRKTLASLKASALVTFDERVQPQLDGVVFRGETSKRPPRYIYPNGSEIVIGGLDRPTRTLSTDYDTIIAFEAAELTEHDWELLLRPLRHGAMPYQQLGGDTNPDAPGHWLRRRMDVGTTREISSRHEDNPLLYDDATQQWTTEGVRYLSVLDRLTGVRYDRLRLGLWVAAEGMVYQDVWDRARNIVDRFRIPLDWPRYLAVDFGHTHPFVCQWWAEDGDGRLYRYRELYYSHRLVEDHARMIRAASRWGERGGDPLPQAVICDHDAEGRATLEAHLGLHTIAAKKDVITGIQAVAGRMRPQADDRPRLFLLRDSLLERDPWLVEAKLPTCTEEEVEGYVWNLAGGRTRGEEPVKDNDHGMDSMRYLVAHKDLRTSSIGTVRVHW